MEAEGFIIKEDFDRQRREDTKEEYEIY